LNRRHPGSGVPELRGRRRERVHPTAERLVAEAV